MTCPHCGQNNFKWARHCDHCRRPLTEGVAPASAGSSTVNEPTAPVTGIEGGSFSFNGVSYTALSRSRESRDADVFPLRHQRSELVIFEMKVFRCDPDTPLYEEIKTRPPKSFRTQAEISAPGAKVVFEEIYEQDGRLLGLQRAYREHPGPAYHAEQMAAAQALLQKQQFGEAIAAYDAILALNPSHVPALGNKGLALINTGNVEKGLGCFERCVGIDANMPEPQINQAAYLAATGQSERATMTLARLLKRYPWSLDHWLALVQMASAEDTLDLAQRFIEPGLAVLGGVPVGERVRAATNESRTRRQAYLSELERARSQQLAKRWTDALETLERCHTLSRRHAIASLNRAICHYHLSDMTACRATVRASHHRLLERSHTLTSMLLWLLSAVALEDCQAAIAVVVALQHHIANGMPVVELPRVPVAALPSLPHQGVGLSLDAASVLEDLDVAPVLTALNQLGERPEGRANSGAVEAVVAGYKQLAAP
jgi:tetratricopeptide (TPR) repeat protein